MNVNFSASLNKFLEANSSKEITSTFLFLFLTYFNNGAKIDAPKEFLGKKVYVIVRK